MYRRICLVLAACIAICGALAPTTCSAVQIGDAAQTPAAPAEELIPEGQPEAISDWALAGVIWSDAHLLRRLADAVRERMQNPDGRERMGLLVQDCDGLIDSLESFGWRRVAEARREQEAAERAVATDDAVAVERAVALEDVEPADRVVATERAVEVGGERPFSLGRYRVDDYIDRTQPRTPAEAAEDGVGEALAAGANDAARGFEDAETTVEQSRVDHRRAQTESATLPYSTGTIYDYHPSATYPEIAADAVPVPPNERIVPAGREAAARVPLESEAEDAAELALTRRAPRVAEIDLDAYTEQAERFSQDAAWVEFRLRANQQRWQMLRDSADGKSVAALAEHVNAVIMQLKADAATAAAATNDPQLIEILDAISNSAAADQ